MKLKNHTRENPLIINAWKFGDSPTFFFGHRQIKLLNNKTKEIGVLGDVNRDCLSRPNISYCDPARRRAKLDQEFEGKVKFTIRKKLDENDSRRSSGWSFSIDVPSGGILQTDELYLYDSPMEGYSQTWTVEYLKDMSGDSLKGFNGGRYNFFVKLNNGQHYGRIHINLDTFRMDYSFLEMEYFINIEEGNNLDIPVRETARLNGGRRYINYEYR